MNRFDDRLPPKGKNSDEFQKFVGEALRSGRFKQLLGDRYVRTYSAPGRDGAIDHLAISEEDQIAIECKFFGKDRVEKKPESDWPKVANTLGRNLRSNADKNPRKISRLYKPWFNTDLPIKSYWFCTSGKFSPGGQDSLPRKIKNFFAELAREHSCLAHLEAIEVEVFGWDEFDRALDENLSLRFRWFRELPIGLRPLRSITERKTFRKFLEDGTLRFFSREEFNREIGFDNEARLTDEQSILSTLLEGDDQLGLVLPGPGGVGKTRLALQLGLGAEASNWLVLQVERNARGEAIEKLARKYTSPAQVLLIIDYAEAARSLFELAQEMERANIDGGHRFRFVATCRASALSVVKETLEESTYQIIEFSGKSDVRYANWVVRKILESAKIPNADDIAPVYTGLPVLAAFAVFLFTQHTENFDAQFGQIHHTDDFAKWADKRLKLALNSRGLDDQPSRRPLAAIAARLPLSAEEHNVLRSLNNEPARFLDLLQSDRWIESNGDGIAAAHDIFTDAIIARYIFEATGTITDRVGDVLIDATDAGAFDRALIALNRLGAHQHFGSIDGLEAIKRVHAHNPTPVLAAHKLLLITRLPDNQTPINMLAALPDIAAAVAADKSCDGPISYLAEAAASSNDVGWRDKATLVLQPFLDRAVERYRGSNIVVRRALQLLPTRYRDQASAWIRREPRHSDTHYLFVAWLQSGLPLEEILEDIEYWFANGGKSNPKASFVFSAWLDAAAKLDPKQTATKIVEVETHLRDWFKEYSTSEATGFVYKSWLETAAKLNPKEAATKIAEVETYVLAWLTEHGKSDGANFVYKSWLDAAAKLDRIETAVKIANVETYMLAWLTEHGNSEVARFVYQSWFDAAATLEWTEAAAKIARVETYMLAWLDEHGKIEDAQFVYKSWLNAAIALDWSKSAAKIAQVETYMLAWLDEHGKIEEARFVYQPWLNAAATLDRKETEAKIAQVETYVLAWLTEHGNSEVARFVYQPWLDAGGSTDLLRSSIIGWLSACSGSQSSDFVIKAWLEATRDFSTVRTPALSWLKQNTNNPEAVFVLKFVVRDRDIPPDAIEDVISWCTNFPDNFDAICRIGPLVTFHANGSLQRQLIEAALLTLSRIQMDWLNDKGVRDATLGTIGSLAFYSRFRDDIKPRLDTVHAKIFRHSSAYLKSHVARTRSFALNHPLAEHVAGMIERHVLDPEADLDALKRFADWLAAWPPNKKTKLRSALQALEQHCPIPGLWSRVGVN